MKKKATPKTKFVQIIPATEPKKPEWLTKAQHDGLCKILQEALKGLPSRYSAIQGDITHLLPPKMKTVHARIQKLEKELDDLRGQLEPSVDALHDARSQVIDHISQKLRFAINRMPFSKDPQVALEQVEALVKEASAIK